MEPKLLTSWNGCLPDGICAVRLGESQNRAPLAICLVVSSKSPGNPFVLIHETADALVYLGCMVDKNNRVKEWLEIWKQSRTTALERLGIVSVALTNAGMERSWQRRVRLLAELNPQTVFATGWEEEHGAPIFIDPASMQICHPADEGSGRPFTLCQDEAALARAGLPSYQASLERFLWNEEDRFLTTGPEAEAVYHRDDVHRICNGFWAFNADASLLAVRRLSPMRLDEAVDLLGGKSWAGLRIGDSNVHLDRVYQLATDYDQLISQGGHFLENRSPTGTRLIEVLHLKMNLLFQAFALIHHATRSLRSPFLNLRPESFRVRLLETGNGLPFLWTSRVDLTEIPSAQPVDLPGTDTRIFMADQAQSIFQVAPLSRTLTGHGSVRIRQMRSWPEERISMEITVVTDERLQLRDDDVVHFVLPLAGSRFDLFARKTSPEASPKGETRLVTVRQDLPEELNKKLKNAVGHLFERIEFEVLCSSSSVNDLYSLAIIAIRTLLVDEQVTLPVAVDELTSLARETAQHYGEKVPWRERLLAIVREDDRWSEWLGPHRLTREKSLKERASLAVPSELWWSVVGWMVRLLPGIGPDSYCPDFAAAPDSAMERVFERPITDLKALQARTRSLLLGDWVYQDEVRRAIDYLISDALYAPGSGLTVQSSG
jgi:hypothetical protein